MYVNPDPECDEEGWGEARSATVAVAVAAIAAGAYAMAYGVERYLTYTDHLGEYGVALQFGVLAAVLLAHEAVHALAYATVGRLSWDEIEVEFELFPEDSHEPFDHSVHPVRPVRRWAYYVCVAAPGVLLGVVPATVALLTGHSLAMFVGLVGLLLVATDVGPLVEAWRHPDAVAAADPTY